MDLGLKNKNAIITGGSQGVGLAIAEALAREGCNIAIGARGQDRLEKVAGELGNYGVKTIPIVSDFSETKGCIEFVDQAEEALGSIDILINNVGGMHPGSIETLDDEQWRASIDLNLMSYIRTARACIPHLKKSKAGRVLNVAGLSGTQLFQGTWTSTISNTAILGMTKQLASELAPDNITVNSICPGIVKTEAWMSWRADALGKAKGMTGEEVRNMMSSLSMLNRLGEPEEIGNVAAFLVSTRNSYMTGTTVEICGGMSKYIG